jgi:hypothetical protein
VAALCPGCDKVSSAISERLSSLKTGVECAVSKLDTALKSLPSKIESAHEQLVFQIKVMKEQCKQASAVGQALKSVLTDFKADEMRGMLKSVAADLDGAKRLQQMMHGLSDAVFRARDIGLQKEVERLEQGLVAFNSLMGQAAAFRDDVQMLGQLWKNSELSTLVEQNRAWLRLVKTPYHKGNSTLDTNRPRTTAARETHPQQLRARI